VSHSLLALAGAPAAGYLQWRSRRPGGAIAAFAEPGAIYVHGSNESDAPMKPMKHTLTPGLLALIAALVFGAPDAGAFGGGSQPATAAHGG
jgi:hypothetical protein